jgi:hypothetical protein
MTALPAPLSNAGGNSPGCDLIPRIRAAGADLALRDGRLILIRASRVPADLLAELNAHRDELVAEMANDNAAPADRPFVADPVERAAIEAESLPVQNVRKRPVSWARAADEPTTGDFCGCCGGHLWWSESDEPKGWRCCSCRPPAHLTAGAFRAVAT